MEEEINYSRAMLRGCQSLPRKKFASLHRGEKSLGEDVKFLMMGKSWELKAAKSKLTTNRWRIEMCAFSYLSKWQSLHSDQLILLARVVNLNEIQSHTSDNGSKRRVRFVERRGTPCFGTRSILRLRPVAVANSLEIAGRSLSLQVGLHSWSNRRTFSQCWGVYIYMPKSFTYNAIQFCQIYVAPYFISQKLYLTY